MFKVVNLTLKSNLQTLFTLSTVLNLAKMSSATGSCSLDEHSKSPTISKDNVSYSLSYVTIDTEDNAAKLARKIVENDLAACVNIVPKIRSIYKWQGKIEDDSEHLLLIKSKYSLIDKLTKFVKENHHYDVCEVITVPITHGNPDYLKWIDESVKSD